MVKRLTYACFISLFCLLSVAMLANPGTNSANSNQSDNPGQSGNNNQAEFKLANSGFLSQDFRMCRSNCQEYYNVCTLRCRPGSYHYMVCEDACRLDYQACFRICEPALKQTTHE